MTREVRADAAPDGAVESSRGFDFSRRSALAIANHCGVRE
jgi:hypothetical protein